MYEVLSYCHIHISSFITCLMNYWNSTYYLCFFVSVLNLHLHCYFESNGDFMNIQAIFMSRNVLKIAPLFPDIVSGKCVFNSEMSV